MRTKAVYVVVSGETDVYFEQAWVSAWSLKHYNPGMEVECVVDPDTYDQVMGSYRRQALSVIDRLVRVEVPAQYGKKERSRWLKTSVRRHVGGDFLFVDTDTIVCDSLRELDSLAGDVMMVRDHHCPFSEMTDARYILQGIENVLGSRFTEDDYYNSGVIYTKDTPASHAFFEAWHAQWKEFHKQGVHTDQCSLAVLNAKVHAIQDLDDIYNCQIRLSVRFLHRAKIVHFFNNQCPQNSVHPFDSSEVYKQVKKERTLSPAFQQAVLDCKSLFYTQTYILGGEERVMYDDYACRLLRETVVKSPWLYSLINKVSRALLVAYLALKHK